MAKQCGDMIHQLDAAADVVGEIKKEAAELKADLTSPIQQIERELDTKKAQEKLDAFNNSYTTPTTLPDGDGDVVRGRYDDPVDYLPKRAAGVLTIGEMKLDDHPAHLSTGTGVRLGPIVFMFVLVNITIGCLFHVFCTESPVWLSSLLAGCPDCGWVDLILTLTISSLLGCGYLVAVLMMTYRILRAVAPLIHYIGIGVFCDPAKLKHIRLVLIPRSKSRTLPQDMRPEMDRGERFSRNRIRDYSVCVEVRTNLGFCYYKSWANTLPSMWFKSHGRTLKRVSLNDGLMSTALNRKTLLASRDHPEVAIDTMTRLISANPHYQEDYLKLYDDGQSIYRDMSLVAGAIVSRDVYHSNEHF